MEHNKDLVEIARFLDNINGAFETLRDGQETLVSAYNILAERWRDRVYVITGQTLTETAKTIRKAYSAFSDAAIKLQRVHTALCEYQEIDEARHYRELEFPIGFDTEGNMNNGKMMVSASDIEAFERALASYNETLCEQVKRICLEYEAVGSSWNDIQYTRLGEDVAEFKKNVSAQSNAIAQLSALLGKKRRIIEEAEKENDF